MRLPGRETRLREPAFTRLLPLVETLAEVLRPVLHQPFAFFGHSLGALVGYELARYLGQQEGVQPVHLFVSAYRAPHLPPHHSPIHQASDERFITRLRELNGAPAEFFQHPELMEMMIPVLRADFALWETHVREEIVPLDCPISALGGLEDGEATRADMAAWRDYTKRAFTLRMIAGDHFFLQSNTALVLQAIARDLLPYLRK